ncbi:hypothetical protein CLG85_006850 [Yangia mangrovi]|uniref:Uncharacterized protein n=1 Tax=Alloyangia mangrovi TaxID=1779329 RepID=A0A2A3JXA3_9RHOB|nr:hypothetical protein [Alloyangia mangrovi]MCT4370066.1 hypothetical protein [Alloyangia mangrovi]
MVFSRVLAGACALSLLAACEPTTAQLVTQGKPIDIVYPVKAGVTAGQLQNDVTDCQIEAAQRVPQQILTTTTPTHSTPAETQCVTKGKTVTCTTTGGEIYGGETYSYDANEGLRARAEGQCLSGKGYRLATIPKCPAGDATRPVMSQLYPLSAATCYLPGAGGSYAVTEALR